MINTHGMKMKGLKAASGSTVNYGSWSSEYDEIFYDRETGEVWTKYHIGHNSWTVYEDDAILKICETSRHLTMQQIADNIAEVVRNHDNG